MSTIEYKVLLCTHPAWPLPPPLKPKSVLRKVGSLSEASFPSEAGKEAFRRLAAEGYTLLSWPDGVRCAVRGNRPLSQAEGLAVYASGRRVMELNASQLVVAQGGRG